MLPDRLRVVYNAADITDHLIKDVGESPLVFVESRGSDFPTTTLLKILQARLGRSAFLMTTEDW